MSSPQPSWSQWKAWLAETPLPAALVYLPALDENIRRLRAKAEQAGKPVRVASKSVRSVPLLRRILAQGEGAFRGLMCFAVPEAARLADAGFDDLLVAYPTVQAADMALAAELAERAVGFKLVVDSTEHLQALDAVARGRKTVVDVVIELDVSYRPLHARVHLGVRRSPLRDAAHVRRLAEAAAALRGVRVVGLMGYEAHIAGLTDRNPFDGWFNPVKTAIKTLSIPDVRQRRSEGRRVGKECRCRGWAYH